MHVKLDTELRSSGAVAAVWAGLTESFLGQKIDYFTVQYCDTSSAAATTGPEAHFIVRF